MADTPFGLDFKKGNGLIPAIVQDANDGEVLMLAYVNEEALDQGRNVRQLSAGS